MGPTDRRWSLSNLLPVAFVLWLVSSIWSVYIRVHLWHVLQIDLVPQAIDLKQQQEGLFEATVCHVLVALFWVCFVRAMSTDPGAVARDKTVKALLDGSSAEGDEILDKQQELKANGIKRFCKWCGCYKPDRCHHCRICRSCVLRMDHHCPWIANCVGFKNHKFFFLLVFYALLCVIFMGSAMLGTAREMLCLSPPGGLLGCVETTFSVRFSLVFGITMCVIMSVLLSLFFTMHCWLMVKGMSTIEFCEMKTRSGKYPRGYDLGVLKNVRAVLGDWTMLWLLPLSPPSGDGIVFEREEGFGQRGHGASSRGGPRSHAVKTSPERKEDDADSSFSVVSNASLSSGSAEISAASAGTLPAAAAAALSPSRRTPEPEILSNCTLTDCSAETSGISPRALALSAAATPSPARSSPRARSEAAVATTSPAPSGAKAQDGAMSEPGPAAPKPATPELAAPDRGAGSADGA